MKTTKTPRKRKTVTTKTPKKPVKTRENKRSNKRSVTKSNMTLSKPAEPVKTSKITSKIARAGSKTNPWVPLSDLRSYNAIADLDYPTKVKFEAILKTLITELNNNYNGLNEKQNNE